MKVMINVPTVTQYGTTKWILINPMAVALVDDATVESEMKDSNGNPMQKIVPAIMLLNGMGFQVPGYNKKEVENVVDSHLQFAFGLIEEPVTFNKDE